MITIGQTLMIEAIGLKKTYEQKVAVDDLSFGVRPGIVTGFLGPNGAGKSTTMRLLLGLDRPDVGQALINGRPYRELEAPLSEVGALLEAKAVHPGRSARAHLIALARTQGIAKSRVDEVLQLVGIEAVASEAVGSFSLGMGQRLGIAVALLGDPQVVMLDEPINGLDAEGIHWVRSLLRYLAGEGRTVFVSSHVMSEMAITADHLIVIGQGRLIADTSVSDFIDAAGVRSVRVRSPQLSELRAKLIAAGGSVAESTGSDDAGLSVTGLSIEAIGELAAAAGLVLHELTEIQASLEEAFMEQTGHAVDYQTGSQVGSVGASAFDASDHRPEPTILADGEREDG